MTRIPALVPLIVALLLWLPPVTYGEQVRDPQLAAAGRWQMLWTDLPAATQPGARIELISRFFLGTPYRAGTLIGSATVAERLVSDLSAVDCFTFLDYVEALRRCDQPAQFRAHLARVRYRDGIIDFVHRRHFFTDWIAGHGTSLEDVTGQVGGEAARIVRKRLNTKKNGILWIDGLPATQRAFAYIPSAAVDGDLLCRLRIGDYLGIYSDQPGLDVSHTGIVIRSGERLLLRHASSHKKAGRVIDSDLLSYLQDKPGLVVLRPRTPRRLLDYP